MHTLTNQELYVTKNRLMGRVFRQSVDIAGMRFNVSMAKAESPKKTADKYTLRKAKRRFTTRLNGIVKLQNLVFNRDALVLNNTIVNLESLETERKIADSHIMSSYKLEFEESMLIDEDSVFKVGNDSALVSTSLFSK